MELIIKTGITLLGGILLSGALALLFRPRTPKKGEVRLPVFLLIVGLLASALTFALALVALFSDESMIGAIVCLALSSLGVLCIMGYFHCRITYDEAGFTHQNIIGIKKRYSYHQITGLSGRSQDKHLHIGRRKILLDTIAIGRDEFLAFAKKRYRTENGGKAIPNVTKQDIFRGHIENPGEFIFIYGMLVALLLAFLILILIAIFKPITKEKSEMQTAVLASYYEEDGKLVLTGTDSAMYRIIYSPDALPMEAIASVTDGKTSLTLYGLMITPDDGVPHFRIHAIYAGEDAIFSFEECNALNRRANAKGLYLVGGFAVIVFSVITLSVIVGRDPKKYRKIVYLFFKKDYVHFD